MLDYGAFPKTSVTSMKFCNKLVKTKKENKVALFVGSVDEILFKWYFCVVPFVSIFRVVSNYLVIYAGSKGGKLKLLYSRD